TGHAKAPGKGLTSPGANKRVYGDAGASTGLHPALATTDEKHTRRRHQQATHHRHKRAGVRTRHRQVLLAGRVGLRTVVERSRGRVARRAVGDIVVDRVLHGTTIAVRATTADGRTDTTGTQGFQDP